ncbi:acyclic terpene utilization AtuA family protein [Litoreibacter arenae]|uniref:3-methylaspartate ammonia-lyase / glutamate mutase n=1 Tax=Litoreibacter arenae DSM 19593 TaxID=1123360 RepID=S9QJL0_9RHOB|nr:acyclic terpene utilization AtuA family protein [Litoreibacter arenae]EPX81601.1 3-methylaspartate ammonia-lyase / glutamate mutase [Litoreibacter arenae DSM 19593]
MVKVLIPSGALGLGYDRAALARGISERPDIIAIDGGSTDSGPHYLGTGTSKYARGSTKAEWRELMQARAEAGVPLVIGTAGTCGANSAVDWLAEITREIAGELGMTLKLAVLKSGQRPDAMIDALGQGKISPLSPAPDISEDVLASCSNIVALAGAEQIQAALETGADIVIAGRTTDTAIISALPLARGCHAGAAWHGAKIGECGALATTAPNSGTILVEFDAEGFTITPMGAAARATAHTVSAHMLYENSNPNILYEPGGHLDVTHAVYTALDDKRVRVTGSEWVVSDRYTVKLEGARLAGFQTVSLVTVRDPRYVANIRAWCDDIVTKATEKARARVGEDFEIELRVIGLDATLGALDTDAQVGTEVGVLALITAPTEALSRDVAKVLNPYLLHHPLTEDEEMPTFAFPFSPPEMSRGAVYEFCLNHVLELDDPMEAFSLTVEDLGA